MSEPVRVGLIDSGVDAAAGTRIAAQAAFHFDAASGLLQSMPADDCVGHGSSLARLILQAAPRAQLLNAQVFRRGDPVSAAAVAAALGWCVAAGARVVNLSLGLRDDRQVLRSACSQAAAAGVLLVASLPARGPVTYPAAYPGVIAVCGDARCGGEQWSALAPATFGACPRGPTGEGGASYAAARVSGVLARFLEQSPAAGADAALAYLADGAAFRGRERRNGEGACAA